VRRGGQGSKQHDAKEKERIKEQQTQVLDTVISQVYAWHVA